SADGTGSAARFSGPNGVVVDGAGNLYVADSKLRKLTPDGVVTTLVGSVEQVAGGYGVDLDSAGNLFVADQGNITRIRKVTPAGVETTFASGSFFFPW